MAGLVVLGAACDSADTPVAGPEPTTSESHAPSTTTGAGGGSRTVADVIDGDTIEVDTGERVRLIGIDTPETKHPTRGVECYGREAAARTEQLLPVGTSLRLEYDVQRLDRFGRTLAYVYRISDDLFVNLALVQNGYAQAFTYPPNVSHADEFVAAAREAREAGRGLWGPACEESAATSAAPSGGCDPSYPDVCIPAPPPDLDCGDVPDRRFRVRGADPHRFDSDADGVGCET